MYGSTSGFLIIAWKTMPATASPAPTAIAASTLGRRRLNRVLSTPVWIPSDMTLDMLCATVESG